MKYKDLPNRTTCVKLMMISFASPQKNLQVFKFAEAIKPLQEFVANEHNKLIDKYGRMNDDGVFAVTNPEAKKQFAVELEEFLEQDITGTLPKLDLTEDDFSENNCRYPTSSDFWLNAFEINSILNMIEALKTKKEK